MIVCVQAPKGLPSLDAAGSIDNQYADSDDGSELPPGFPTNGNGANGSNEVEHVAHILPWLRAFGYTRESLELLMAPMAATGVWPAPLFGCLSGMAWLFVWNGEVPCNGTAGTFRSCGTSAFLYCYSLTSTENQSVGKPGSALFCFACDGFGLAAGACHVGGVSWVDVSLCRDCRIARETYPDFN